MAPKRALIFGVAGQDGYFMSWLLAGKGYEIIGLRRPSSRASETIAHLPGETVRLVEGSICDTACMKKILLDNRPDEIYNFAGISFIPESWNNPGEVIRVNGTAVADILDLIRRHCPDARFFQAGSSEIFGHNADEFPQNEETPFRPDSPYGSSKVLACNLVRNFREKYQIFACSGILYNHESQWRPSRFVTRKITLAAASTKLGLSDEITLGELAAQRDWSFAGDIVEGAWLATTARSPADYVFASGRPHSVTDVLEIAYSRMGLDWHDHVVQDSSFSRAAERRPLCGDASKAASELGWKPKVSFQNLIEMMVDADLKRMEQTLDR